jgi:CheY-like chemotaxis protein
MFGTILLVEDDSDDGTLARNTFAQARILNPIQVVPDVEAAISYLQGQSRFADRTIYPFPILVLLDLRLPDRPGFEVLEWVKAHFPTLPVIVVSGITGLSHLQQAYRLGAHTFIGKPLRVEDLKVVLSNLKGFRLMPSDEQGCYIAAR